MKKFIAGLIIGLMLTSTVSFAANQDISAVLTNFNFIVNGQAKTIATQPIVYNGTSYLPVRELSNMLGYDVEYNTDTRTIALNNLPLPETTKSPSSSNLTDLIHYLDLYNDYGVEYIGEHEGKSGPWTLTYKGTSIETNDYVVIDDKLYFHKSVLRLLGIDQ